MDEALHVGLVILGLIVALVLASLAVRLLWRRRDVLRSGWARLFVVGWALWLPLAAVWVDANASHWHWEPFDWGLWGLLAFALPPVAALTIRWVVQGFRRTAPRETPPPLPSARR